MKTRDKVRRIAALIVACGLAGAGAGTGAGAQEKKAAVKKSAAILESSASEMAAPAPPKTADRKKARTEAPRREPTPEVKSAMGPAAGSFWQDRALDLCDFFRVRVHLPNGFRAVGLKLRGTCLAQAGFIYFDGKSLGLDRRGVGEWRERRLEGGLLPAYFSRVEAEMVRGNRFTDVNRPWSKLYRRGIVRNGTFWDDGRLHPLSCGFELELFVTGLEFETYPLEWVDAVLGWVGLDPFHDDESRVLRQWQRWQRGPEFKLRDEWKERPPREPKIGPPPDMNAAPPAEKRGEAPPEPEKK